MHELSIALMYQLNVEMGDNVGVKWSVKDVKSSVRETSLDVQIAVLVCALEAV